MSNNSELGPLVSSFALLSLVAVGGINSTLPEMHRLVVDVHGWTTESEFTELFAISQAAPGPNLLVVTLIGWHVAGLAGALATTLAVTAPSAILAYVTTRTWTRFREARWRKAIQAGMIPVTVGLVAAGALVITDTVTGGNWRAIAVTAVTAALVTMTRLHPLIPLAAAGGLGAAGLLQG